MFNMNIAPELSVIFSDIWKCFAVHNIVFTGLFYLWFVPFCTYIMNINGQETCYKTLAKMVVFVSPMLHHTPLKLFLLPLNELHSRCCSLLILQV